MAEVEKKDLVDNNEEKEQEKTVEKEVKKVFKKEEIGEEIFLDSKKEKSTFSKVLNIILWVALFSWMAICLVDFFMVKSEKEPIFCINRTTTSYEDGKVTTCLGLGYKVHNYQRESYRAIDFGPFWSKDRSANK